MVYIVIFLFSHRNFDDHWTCFEAAIQPTNIPTTIADFLLIAIPPSLDKIEHFLCGGKSLIYKVPVNALSRVPVNALSRVPVNPLSRVPVNALS